MDEPEMKCGGDLVDWEFESQIGWITLKETPEICAECECFQACFMNRSSQILGMPWLSEEEVKRLASTQKFVQEHIFPDMQNLPEEQDAEFTFDENMEEFSRVLYKWFPGISAWTVKKHIAFTELLEDYNNSTVIGMRKFLDDRWYEVEDIKILNSKIGFTDDQTIEITKGKLLVWAKNFYEYVKWIPELQSYLILAKKKNKWWIEGVKEALKDFMSPNPQESMS